MSVMAAPTRDRDAVVDALRGIAVMGILAVNILVFAWPSKVSMDPSLIAENGIAYEGAQVWSFGAMFVLFMYKMQFLFGLLFGAGAVYYARKFEGAGAREGTALWCRRMAVLLGIGLAHAIGLWYGDILVTYALVGLVALWWVRRWRVGTLIASGSALIALGWLLGGGFIFLLGVSGDAPESPWDPSTFAAEMGAYGAGSGYLNGVTHRLFMLVFMYLIMLPLWFGPYFLGVMMLGMALMKARVLQGERPGVSAALAVVGLGVGLTGSVVAALIAEGGWLGGNRGVGLTLHYVCASPTALGYIGLVTLALGGGRLSRVTGVLAPVGRMALTNYLLQTVICTTVFYGYGLGLFGRVGFVGLAAFVGCVWLVNITLSGVWLSRYRFGPMEWVWRSLTYGRAVGRDRGRAALTGA